VAIERGLNDAALYTLPAPVDEAHLPPPRRDGFIDVVRHDRRDVARPERVQIQLAFDRNAEGLVSH